VPRSGSVGGGDFPRSKASSPQPPIEQAAILMKNAKNKEAARAFLDFVKSDGARATLAKYGFTFPAKKTAAPTAMP